MSDNILLEALTRAQRDLQQIYSGDEGPVLLRTKMARCARRYEAGVALKRVTIALRDYRDAKKKPPTSEPKS